MRANSSDSQDTVTAEHPIKPERLRLLDRLSKYRQPIGLAVTLLLFAIALIACRHLLSELDLYALHDSILAVPKPALLGAVSATVVGFIILLGYEWSASRYAGVALPPRTLALGGFTAFAIGNAIGLSLLSGGERSLAAVALLTAIFKARPSPFYIMDEVEAALDDTNLGRLIVLFEELRDSSQLIVITHQKRTMEIADALYGVTMGGDGMSKVISQRLSHGTDAEA